MAQPNGNSPQFPGTITAKGFVTTGIGSTPASVAQTVRVVTNGTTPVDVFGTTNGITGTFTGTARILPINGTHATISLKNNPSGTESTLFTVIKGTYSASAAAASAGSTYFPATAFVATGTAQVVASAAGNAVVEIDFIVSHPGLPGAQ